MNKRVFGFDLNGKTVLGFDTGLSARSFAQAKMARLIAQAGYIVYPNGETGSWKPEGVAELESEGGPSMIIWGPHFPGEELTSLINDSGRKDLALNGLRFWLRARMILDEKLSGTEETPFPGPSGAFIVTEEKQNGFPFGTVFFAPDRLLKRTLEAEGEEALLEAERLTDPDLKGPEGISFSTGAMLYRIFSGSSPFPQKVLAELRQDIREAVFIPPDLAAPGIDPALSLLISRSLGLNRNKNEKERPSPLSISEFFGPAFSRPVSSWIKPLSEEEIFKIKSVEEQFAKRKAVRVKTRRFVIRNTAIIAGAAVVLLVAFLIARDLIQSRAGLPTTKGMSPVEVAEAYYNAFGSLDHAMMEACVTGRAGKQDIATVMNLFVISRVRQAYESGEGSFMSARDWIDAGRHAADLTIFGVTDLSIKILSQNSEQAMLEADYVLWMPPGYSGDEGTIDILLPASRILNDELSLAYNKGAWRITEIMRNEE